MTTVRITSGACGFITMVYITKSLKKNEPYTVEIKSDCEHVGRMAEDIKKLDRMAAFIRFNKNPVYKAADRHLKHISCPVPSGVLMALEVEAGFRLPKDAHIRYMDRVPERER